jgi:Mlc titration factor MtfA (ptsG expression regulator)
MLEAFLKFWYGLFPPVIPEDFHRILNRHSTYYRHLNADNQQRFDFRLFLLLKLMTFVPYGISEASREMKVIIGSAIIQITFGLKQFLLKRFNRVYILPRPYRYPGYREPFQGHVDFSEEVICLSWPDVMEGFRIPDDAVNVALHEIAHSLEAENHFNWLPTRFFDGANWSEWATKAARKLTAIRNNEHQLLKAYAGQNMREMFAVCIETFFEKPESFKTNLPELYHSLTVLLNQDPTNEEDPVIFKGK